MKKIKEYVREPEFKMIIKNNIINIENYISINDIEDTKIEIINDKEKVIIKGQHLKINKLLESELLILGKYNNILFEGIDE